MIHLPRITLVLAWVTILDGVGALANPLHAGLFALLGILFALHPHQDAAPSFVFVATGILVLRVTFALPVAPTVEAVLAAAGVMVLAALDRSAPGAARPPEGRA